MFRKGASLLICCSSMATAGVGGPPIAYVQGSTRGDVVYLVNPDGTALTKLYSAGSNGRAGNRIDRIALLPGGGEIAMIENNFLKVLRYDASGHAVGTARSVSVNGNCAVGDVDYRADGTLLVSDGCLSVRTVAPGASSATLLFQFPENIASIRWMLDGSVLFHAGGLGSMALKRWSGGTITTIAPENYFPSHIGMSRISNEAAVSDSYTFKRYDLATGASTPGCKQAGNVQLSPDGRDMLYKSPTSESGSGTLFVQHVDCSGMPFRLAVKGGYRAIAWRAD